MESLVNFFSCGYVAKYEKRSLCEFIVTRIEDIVKHIIPFFDKYYIVDSKHHNYLIFKEAALIIKNKEHLDLDKKGLKKLLELKQKIK